MVDENNNNTTAEKSDKESMEPSANADGSTNVPPTQNTGFPGAWDIWIQRGTVALGVIFLFFGGAFKIYNMRTYTEDFFAGQSYVVMVVGVVAIILGLAYNFIFFDDESNDITESDQSS